jgi:hypothetical protein
MVIKFEALLEDFLYQVLVMRRFLASLRHLELNVEIAVATVGNHHRKCFAKSNSNSTEIKLFWADLNLAIATSPDNHNAFSGCLVAVNRR